MFIFAPTVHVLASPAFSAPENHPFKVGPFTVEDCPTDSALLGEFAGRNCYQSWSNPAGRTNAQYIGNIMKQAHGSVLEHANYSLFVQGVSRSLTHEWVRHRAGWAYSQLSQRYVDEADVEFVVPPAIIATEQEQGFRESMLEARLDYRELSDALYERYAHIEDKVVRRKTAREAARSVLPNATETKLVATANLRAWRGWLELRGSEGAEREIRRLAVYLTFSFKLWEPAYFHDFEVYEGADGVDAVRCQHHKV